MLGFGALGSLALGEGPGTVVAIAPPLVWKRLFHLRRSYRARERFHIKGAWPLLPRHITQIFVPPVAAVYWKQQPGNFRFRARQQRERFKIKGAHPMLPRHIVSINRPIPVYWKQQGTNLRFRGRQQRERFQIMGRWPHHPRLQYTKPLVPQFIPWKQQPANQTLRGRPPRRRFKIKGAHPMLPRHVTPYRVTEFTAWAPAFGPGIVKYRQTRPGLADERAADPQLVGTRSAPSLLSRFRSANPKLAK